MCWTRKYLFIINREKKNRLDKGRLELVLRFKRLGCKILRSLFSFYPLVCSSLLLLQLIISINIPQKYLKCHCLYYVGKIYDSDAFYQVFSFKLIISINVLINKDLLVRNIIFLSSRPCNYSKKDLPGRLR